MNEEEEELLTTNKSIMTEVKNAKISEEINEVEQSTEGQENVQNTADSEPKLPTLEEINKEKKRVLREDLDKLKKQMLSNSKDAHYAEKLYDAIISTKGQLGIEAMVAYQPYEKVLSVIEFNGMRLTIGETFACHHAFGIDTIIRPIGAVNDNLYSYYRILSNLHELKERTEKQEEEYNTLLGLCTIAPYTWVRWSTDQERMVNEVLREIAYENELAEKANNAELQPEDADANEAFKQEELLKEQIKNSIENKENE